MWDWHKINTIKPDDADSIAFIKKFGKRILCKELYGEYAYFYAIDKDSRVLRCPIIDGRCGLEMSEWDRKG